MIRGQQTGVTPLWGGGLTLAPRAPRAVDLQANYFTGSVNTALLTRYGNSPLQSNCLKAASGQRAVCNDPYSDYLALVDLYNSAGGSRWVSATNWLSTQLPACAWFGVACVGGHVTYVQLGDPAGVPNNSQKGRQTARPLSR